MMSDCQSNRALLLGSASVRAARFETHSPRTKDQQRRHSHSIVEAASEAADKLMLKRIVADPAVLFRKGRVDWNPVRKRPALMCKAARDAPRDKLIERLEDRHLLDALLMIDRCGRNDHPHLWQAEVTEQVARYEIWKRVMIDLQIERSARTRNGELPVAKQPAHQRRNGFEQQGARGLPKQRLGDRPFDPERTHEIAAQFLDGGRVTLHQLGQLGPSAIENSALCGTRLRKWAAENIPLPGLLIAGSRCGQPVEQREHRLHLHHIGIAHREILRLKRRIEQMFITLGRMRGRGHNPKGP